MPFYKPEEEIFHNGGRGQALLAFIESHPEYKKMRDSPERILAAIDQYGCEKEFLMNIGQNKGKIVTKRISECKPTVMIELGGYLGYSAIIFGNALKMAGGRNTSVWRLVRCLLQCPTPDVVEIKIGPCRDSLRILGKQWGGHGLDMIFFDHAKTEYTNDLKLCEELGLVYRSTFVVADNVINPGNPAYLEYIRTAHSKRQERYRKESLNSKNDKSMGNPRLLHDTYIVHGIEPTGQPDGVEISRCIGVEG